jgi:Rps23 Pro-64 3,4-dihydroxylase Tpa1-like proline 4-hydroxylase
VSDSPILVGQLELFDQPFPHFTKPVGLGTEVASDLLAWLESAAPWRLMETDFYEQYEIDLRTCPRTLELSSLTDAGFLAKLTRLVEVTFDCKLSSEVECSAHKLVSGQTIRIHNDLRPRGETHRVLVQLNRAWEQSHGGFLMFFGSSEPSDVAKLLAPLHDTVVGFEISERSHHAVSTVHAGDRYTLVFSFRRSPPFQ